MRTPGRDPLFYRTPYPYGELTEEWGYFYFSPGDYPTVTLVSEKVEIVLYHNHAGMYGRYLFENTGPALTMGMAMPLVAGWRSMSVPYVLVGVGEPGEAPSDRCQIDHWKAYDTETDPVNPPLSGHWATWFLDIPAGERREVWVTYDTPFSHGNGLQIYDLWEVEEDEIRHPHRYLNYQVYSSAFWPEIVERTSLRFILGHGVTWEDLASTEGAAWVNPVEPEDFQGTQISLGPDFFELIFDRFEPRTEPKYEYDGDFFPASDSWDLKNIWLWIGEYPHPSVNLQYSASSELVPEGGHDYKALNTDSLYASNDPWCEGVDGKSVGEWIKVEMAGEARLTGVTIFNGYHSDGDLYWKNGRAKRIICTADVKGEIYRSIISFDESTEHVRDFRHPSSAYLAFENPLEPEALKLTLEEVYPGDVWSDTCIGCIAFDFFDPRTHHRASSSLVEELDDQRAALDPSYASKAFTNSIKNAAHAANAFKYQ